MEGNPVVEPTYTERALEREYDTPAPAECEIIRGAHGSVEEDGMQQTDRQVCRVSVIMHGPHTPT